MSDVIEMSADEYYERLRKLRSLACVDEYEAREKGQRIIQRLEYLDAAVAQAEIEEGINDCHTKKR